MNVSTAHYAFSTVTITITTVTRKIRGENVIYIYINKMHLIYKKGILKKLLRISVNTFFCFKTKANV